MATYKLMQDIEAEDHILGPLSFRQFVYALIAVFFYYLCFLAVHSGAVFLLVVLSPPALFLTFFAFPFGKDQPTEVWALAKLRFLFKPRARVWNQSGVKELVTITVPKKIEHVYTNGLSEHEVHSRLSALANTLDSRGWAVKNVNVNQFSQYDPFGTADTDRLVDISTMPQEVPNYDVVAADDILDERSNPIAQQFDQMITQSAVTHRQDLIDTMNASVVTPASTTPGLAIATTPTDYWFMNTTGTPLAAQTGSGGPAAGQSTPQEEALIAAYKARNESQAAAYNHMRSFQPHDPAVNDLSDDDAQALSDEPPETEIAPLTMTEPTDAAILSLANNNDLNVATLARQAQKARPAGALHKKPKDEVVISLR